MWSPVSLRDFFRIYWTYLNRVWVQNYKPRLSIEVVRACTRDAECVSDYEALCILLWVGCVQCDDELGFRIVSYCVDGGRRGYVCHDLQDRNELLNYL